MALDNFRKVNITLHKANQRVLETQIAKVGDANGRELVVQITNNGVIEDQTGTTLKLNWQHENGKQGSTTFNVVDIKTGIFSVYYPTEMLYKGKVNASIEISSNGKITNSMNFKIIVQADVFDGEAGTVDGVFISLADVNKKLDDREEDYVELKSRQTSVETQFNSIQQEITNKDVVSAPEIIAARNGEANLNDRLDKEQRDLEGRGYNVQWYALDVVDNDWTEVIQTALNVHKDIFIGAQYEIRGELIPPRGSVIRFGNGGKLLKPETAINDDPIIWIKESYVSILGSGFTNSFIESKKRTPFGAVCLGYKGMDDLEAKNIVYGTISNIDIGGRRIGGETDGIPSSALYMCNPQPNNLPSYFHNINNIRLRNANDGILMVGWVNGNMFNSIHFYAVGNEKQLNGAAIHFKNENGKHPLDNMISNVFHHQSSNAVTLFFDNGGVFNSITNVSSEQGGTSAKWILQTGDTTAANNVVIGIDNVAGSSTYSEEFAKRNTIINRTSLRNAAVITSTLNANTSNIGETTVTSVKSDFAKAKSFRASNLNENSRHGLLRFDLTNMKSRSMVIEFDATTRGGTIGSFLRNGTVKLGVFVNSSGVVTVTELLKGEYSAGFIIFKVEGSVLTLGVKTANNGTATAYTVAVVDYKVVGELDNLVITEILDNSVILPE